MQEAMFCHHLFSKKIWLFKTCQFKFPLLMSSYFCRPRLASIRLMKCLQKFLKVIVFFSPFHHPFISLYLFCTISLISVIIICKLLERKERRFNEYLNGLPRISTVLTIKSNENEIFNIFDRRKNQESDFSLDEVSDMPRVIGDNGQIGDENFVEEHPQDYSLTCEDIPRENLRNIESQHKAAQVNLIFPLALLVTDSLASTIYPLIVKLQNGPIEIDENYRLPFIETMLNSSDTNGPFYFHIKDSSLRKEIKEKIYKKMNRNISNHGNLESSSHDIASDVSSSISKCKQTLDSFSLNFTWLYPYCRSLRSYKKIKKYKDEIINYYMAICIATYRNIRLWCFERKELSLTLSKEFSFTCGCNGSKMLYFLLETEFEKVWFGGKKITCARIQDSSKKILSDVNKSTKITLYWANAIEKLIALSLIM